MKKSVISLALCLSLLIGMMSVMFVAPVSASSGVDFLSDGSIDSCSDGATAEIVNGTLVFTATATGQEVALGIENEANLNDYPYFEGVIESDAPFDIAYYDANNAKWMFAAGDFCYNFGDGLLASQPIPAGTYDVCFSLTGAYTWTGEPLPANAAIRSIYIIAKGAGTITVSTCAMTDGMQDIDLNSRGDQSSTVWKDTLNLLKGDYYGSPAPSADDPQSQIKVTENADGSVIYGNTNGMWPAANYVFDAPICVSESTALDLDFTVRSGCTTTIYLFFGPSTPNSFGDGAYIWVAKPNDIMNSELGQGNYKGVLFLKDTIHKTIGNLEAVDKCYDENGNLVINAIKIFATSYTDAVDNAVTVRKLQLVSLDDITPVSTTTTTTTTTSSDTDTDNTTSSTASTSAVNGVDFLRGAIEGNDQTPADTYSLENGALVFTATTSGQEVSLTAQNEANLNTYPFFKGVIESDVPFDIAWYDANHTKWMFAAGDFCYNFGDDLQASRPIPAGAYNVEFSLTGAYTWTGDPLPANAAIQSIYIIAKGAGTITVSTCAMTDGMKNIDLNTRGDQSATAWQTRIDLIEGDYYGSPAPSIDDPQSYIKVTKNADGSVTYGNTNGMWPAANYVFDTPLTVDPSAALDLDFTVQSGCATTIYMFFGPSTPDNFSDGAYIWVAKPDDILNSDLPLGHYKGVIFLEDTIRKTIGNLNAVDKCYDENGNLVLTGIKIFATSHSGASDNVVTVNKLHLVSDKVTTTTESTTTPTTVPTYAVNGVDFLRGTAQGNDQTPADTYSLDDGTLVFTATTVGQEISLTAQSEANLNDYPYFEGIIESDVPFDIAYYDANNAKWMFAAGDFCVFFGDVLHPSNPIPAGKYDVKFSLTGAYTWSGDPLPADAAVQSIYIVPKEAGTITVTKCAMTDGIGKAEPVPGDLDGDGTTSLTDAAQLFFHVNGTAALTDEEKLLADINGDGAVNLADMTRLFYLINGQL